MPTKPVSSANEACFIGHRSLFHLRMKPTSCTSPENTYESLNFRSIQYGSGGRTVGKMLAEKLGVSFYDKQIIQMASDESGIDVKLFGQVEEGSSVKPSLFNKTGLYKGELKNLNILVQS